MSFSFARSQSNKKEEAFQRPAGERDPLLPPSGSGLRSRRNTSKSPPVFNDFGSTRGGESIPMRHPGVLNDAAAAEHDEAEDSYRGFMAIHDEDVAVGRGLRPPGSMPSVTDDEESAPYSLPSKNDHDLIGMGPPPPFHHHRPRSPEDSRSMDSNSQPPLLEIPEETYAVRKAALKVMKPMMKTWVRCCVLCWDVESSSWVQIWWWPAPHTFPFVPQIIITVGFSLTALFGMGRWTQLLPEIPFWFILMPSWGAHIGLFWLHIISARELSAFIAEANESRQRPDSRDHLNRTEYLPLLQRSLKFGLKTGVLSFFVFLFEILVFIRLAGRSITLTGAFVPLWIIVAGGIVDGLVCKTQHFLRVLCWMLTFASMLMLCLKVDFGHDELHWRIVISPVVGVLSIISGSLLYIIYGHQVGYYRLTEAQLTAGNLYSLATLISIIVIVMVAEVIPLNRPVEVETRLFVVVLAPLVVSLVGMGAWVVSRDEYGRLLLYGGQAAVHPKKLRWEAGGWTGVQGKGVTVIPMFGEVSFRPLEKGKADGAVELCTCCAGGCYPYEEEEEETGHFNADVGYHPYLDPSPSRGLRSAYNL